MTDYDKSIAFRRVCSTVKVAVAFVCMLFFARGCMTEMTKYEVAEVEAERDLQIAREEWTRRQRALACDTTYTAPADTFSFID